jgi:amino-acid N-acetyltransferase
VRLERDDGHGDSGSGRKRPVRRPATAGSTTPSARRCDEHVATMVVANEGREVVGAAAVELYADGALLRSVVVNPTVHGRGLAHRLTEAVLTVAKLQGSPTAFLLTTTAENFFPRLGFERISRDEVPASVQASVEFQSACPASAPFRSQSGPTSRRRTGSRHQRRSPIRP